MFDVVLHGGWVVDGTGAPPLRADLALTGDRIAALGRLDHAPAAERVSCRDRYLFPGFIDAHVHGDALVFDADVQLAALAQGITTFVVGQDGMSFAPASPATFDYVSAYFAAVNGDWPGERPSTTAELLSRYDRATALNVGLLVPQGNLRHEVLGSTDRPVDADGLDRMRALLEQSLEEGALGLSSGLDYVPSRFADAAELAALSSVAARFGVPYVTHMRGYEAAAATGMAEVRSIAENCGAAVHVSHYHGPAHLLLQLVDDMRGDGIDVTFDSYPYTSGASILAMLALPPAVQEGGPARTLERLADAQVRAALKREWFTERAATLVPVRLSYVGADELAWAEGLRLGEAAEKADADIGDFVCDLLLASHLRAGCVFRQPPINTDVDVRALLRHEAHVGGSDAIYLGSRPHPRAWGAFARFLGHHTRELGDWTWAQAASHLAGHTARRYGLSDRGLLRAGQAADVVVLDPATVADVATYDDPRRLAVGVERVYVNGVLAFFDGELKSRDCGRGLRRGS